MEVKETWKGWPGYESLAEVSNLGNARTLDRVIIQKSSLGREYSRVKRGSMLALTNNGTGYLQVRLVVNGTVIREYIHRLVAILFVEGYSPTMEVDHINNIKSDNIYTNLRWISRKDNMLKCIHNNPHVLKNLVNQ